MFGRILMRWTLAMLPLALLGGCTNYAYDVTPPGTPTYRVPTDHFWTVQSGPVDFRFRTADNHLVVQVWNPGSDPVQIVGDKSAIVDPYGRSHAVRTQLIPPGAYARIIIPPVLETVAAGPPVSFSVGVVGGYGGHGHGHWHGAYYGGFYDPFWYDSPPYYAVVGGDQAYWEWDGAGGEARIILVVDQKGQQTTHEVRIMRVKL
jgi:hypothetical protein